MTRVRRLLDPYKEVSKMKLRWVIAFAVAAFALVPAVAGSTPGQPPIKPGGKIVFSSTADGQADIYSMNAVGISTNRPLNLSHDKTTGVRTDVQPTWSPGGAFVAFERQYAKGGADLMVVRSDGTKLRTLLSRTPTTGVWNCHPSWSIGNLIYFTSNRDGNFDLYAASASGAGVLQLTHTKAPIQNLGPEVSPDGKYLLFSRTGVGPSPQTAQLYLLVLAKNATVQVTKNLQGQGDRDAAWSPDSRRIAFTSDRTGTNNIWLVNTNGTGLLQVTHTIPVLGPSLLRSSNVHPTFSPDGSRIAFVSTRTGATEIFVTQTPPSTLPRTDVQLTFDKAFKANPSWQMFSLVP
jgi:Tol biopolymer transport system component